MSLVLDSICYANGMNTTTGKPECHLEMWLCAVPLQKEPVQDRGKSAFKIEICDLRGSERGGSPRFPPEFPTFPGLPGPRDTSSGSRC